MDYPAFGDPHCTMTIARIACPPVQGPVDARHRLVDKADMAKQPDTARSRQIVGFSLPPGMAAAVKDEAARRKVSLRKLFEEMWEGYTARQK